MFVSKFFHKIKELREDFDKLSDIGGIALLEALEKIENDSVVEEINENYTVYDYQKDSRKVIDDILKLDMNNISYKKLLNYYIKCNLI